jgi:hypothetical protein
MDIGTKFAKSLRNLVELQRELEQTLQSDKGNRCIRTTPTETAPNRNIFLELNSNISGDARKSVRMHELLELQGLFRLQAYLERKIQNVKLSPKRVRRTNQSLERSF